MTLRRRRSAASALLLLLAAGCVAEAHPHRPPSQQQYPQAPAVDDEDLSQDLDDENVTTADMATSSVLPPNVTAHHKHGDPLFPKDLFSTEQLRQGAVLFHILGLVSKRAVT